MVCEHLSSVEQALVASGANVTFRGQAWSQNCREWVYFDCYLDLAAVRKHFVLPAFVQDHSHSGTHDGQELGLVCNQCHDAIVGLYQPAAGKQVFQG